MIESDHIANCSWAAKSVTHSMELSISSFPYVDHASAAIFPKCFGGFGSFTTGSYVACDVSAISDSLQIKAR